ncbi:integrase catalytic domain-containing protein [Trichonephila clavipes]|nr:integrase catalytic domain-containing protein [Trichonephila clavipes]
MELHKLCANHEKLSPDPEQNYNFATLTETKTFGVSWKPNLDCFLIKVKVCLDSSYTKRHVLSTIAKIFDPVGLMAPVISKAKIFLQRLWRSKLEWNDLLPAEEYREWQQFLVSLENINNIEIPRRILVAFPEVIEIHGFADASERCYGAAVYCKSKNLKSETLVRLITSKSRVAPIKSLTIPRLELCAAVLLAKLVKRVVAALQLETAELYLWSDSMIVLAWLRKEPMDLKTFVQNRVAKIQELYPNQLWRHVSSDQNPADLVSRGVDPDKLLQQNLWFNGPTFLSAVHIELVSDLTSQAFIAALKRFMARRGKCAKLFSDNGKNFVGASNEIKKLLEIVRNPDEKLANYLGAEGIEWKFIPARSPNFGGLWEAAIKSCTPGNKVLPFQWKGICGGLREGDNRQTGKRNVSAFLSFSGGGVNLDHVRFLIFEHSDYASRFEIFPNPPIVCLTELQHSKQASEFALKTKEKTINYNTHSTKTNVR